MNMPRFTTSHILLMLLLELVLVYTSKRATSLIFRREEKAQGNAEILVDHTYTVKRQMKNLQPEFLATYVDDAWLYWPLGLLAGGL